VKTGIKPATKAEKRRFQIISRDVGCIACYDLSDGILGTPGDVHHLLSPDTGNRISHSHTIALCKAHHNKGPLSTHKAKFKFRERFGSDEYLLALTNSLAAEFESTIVGGKG